MKRVKKKLFDIEAYQREADRKRAEQKVLDAAAELVRARKRAFATSVNDVATKDYVDSHIPASAVCPSGAKFILGL